MGVVGIRGLGHMAIKLALSTGTGLYFSTGDLNGDGKLDIAVAGKDGLAVFWQR